MHRQALDQEARDKKRFSLYLTIEGEEPYNPLWASFNSREHVIDPLQTEVNVTNADSKFFLDNEYNIEETISYAKLRGWTETQILEDVQQRL